MKGNAVTFAFLKTIAVVVFCAFMFQSCEKHDGTEYFKSKCVAKLNGKTYIDQTPVAYIFNPVAMRTPSFRYQDCEAEFNSLLSEKRAGMTVYSVDIFFYVDKPEDLFNKDHAIRKLKIEGPDGELGGLDYAVYCQENNITYAVVNGDFIDGGTFRINSYDKEKGESKGTFFLPLSEGVLEGEFVLEAL